MDRTTVVSIYRGKGVKGLCAVAAAVAMAVPLVARAQERAAPEGRWGGEAFQSVALADDPGTAASVGTAAAVGGAASFIPDGTQLALIPRPHPAAAEPAAPSAGSTTRPTTGAAAAGAAAAGAAGASVTAEADRGEEYVPEPIRPLGYAGGSGLNRTYPGTVNPSSDYIPLPDRWRIGVPGDYVQNTRGSLGNPYTQNVLKGDYPIIGQDKFLILTFTSDTLFEAHRIPVPSGVAAHDEGQEHFFGSGHQQLFIQNGIISLEFFEGDAAYKPRDYEFKATVVGNFNYVHTDELGLISPDPRQGTDRHDDQIAFQELFFDKHLGDLSPKYDIWDVRLGIQGFTSDFRGFLFSDNEPGVRFFGNYDDNKLIWNLAWFHQVEKDTNSGLNTFNSRDQDVFIANLYREDFIWLGYTAQLSFHMNYDRGGNDPQFDQNGFLVRPQPIGTIRNKEDRVYYLGWAGDGHIGRFNLTHQFYQAFGTESFNPIADQETEVNAQFFALELSYDIDWIRLRGSFAYASGDHDPFDHKAEGFDSIFDNPNFAGGGFSYFVRQAIPLTGGGTGLTGRNTLLPDLRTSKEQGTANFVNPGLFLYNVGADFDITPRIKLITNASYLQFADTGVLQTLLFDDKIGRDIGYDLSVGVQWRPLNNQNVIFTVGAAMLIPGNGFKDIYTNDTLYSTFVSATITY